MPTRYTTFGGLLPTVKCSNCGSQIQLSLMGEHVCNDHPKVFSSEDDRIPDRFGDARESGESNFEHTSMEFLKPRRPGPPPRIDPSLANRPFLHPNQITPGSDKHTSRSATPGTPSPDIRQSYRSLHRSHTSSQPRRPPSPEYTNLDCAFPPFPISASRAGSSRAGTPVSDTRGLMSALGGDLGPPKETKGQTNSGPGSRAASFSRPRTQSVSSAGRRSRGNTLASSPDPIPRPATAGGTRRRPSIASTASAIGRSDDEAPPLPTLPPLSFTALNVTSGTSNSTVAQPSHPESSNEDLGSRIGGHLGLAQEKSPYTELNPYGGSAEFLTSPETEKPLPDPWSTSMQKLHLSKARESEPEGATGRRPPPLSRTDSERPSRPLQRLPASPTRSQTFPLHNDAKHENNGPNRRPSEPSRTRQPSAVSNDRPSINEPSDSSDDAYRALTGRPEPPSKFPPRKESRHGLQPSLSNSGQEGRWFMGLRGKPEVNSTLSIPGTRYGDDLDIGNPYHTPSDSASSNGSEVSTAPTETSALRSPPRDNHVIHYKQTSLEVPPVPPIKYGHSPDSPTDPLFQQGRLSPSPRPGPTPPPSHSRQPSPESIRRPPTRAATSKGTCRGCNNLIFAGEKSVSSADGRLTGRYHKACFVCHACHSPFATADFYVHNNSPYCAKHYHEANGSLCSDCGEGIEGQFLEADTGAENRSAAKKFHPGCFTCETCRVMLNDDFFAFGGKIYCERDAFVAAGMGSQTSNSTGHSRANSRSAASRTAAINRANGLLAPGMGMPGGGRKFPERRTTRLMMI